MIQGKGADRPRGSVVWRNADRDDALRASLNGHLEQAAHRVALSFPPS